MRCGLVELIQSAQITSPQVVSNPEACNANHVVQNGLAFGYQAPCLGFGEHSEKARHFQAAVDRDPASALLIHKKKLGRQLGCDNNSFGFTWIELLAKCCNVILVLSRDDPHPQRVKIGSVPR